MRKTPEPRLTIIFSLASPLRLFQNRNYRIYFIGLSLTSAGTWMQSVVQAWLVYRITASAYWLGAFALCATFPAFFMTPIAGVLCDKIERRKILILVQVIGLLQASALAALVGSGAVQVWHLMLLGVVQGVMCGLDITTRHAFAVDLVGKEDLPAAISMNAVLMNGARVAGPALAGLLIGPLGEARCFALNALSCVPQIAALSMIRPLPRA